MLLMVCGFILLLHSGSLGAKCPGTAKRCALASLNANVPSSYYYYFSSQLFSALRRDRDLCYSSCVQVCDVDVRKFVRFWN